MPRRWAGAQLDGWHDWSTRDWDAEDEEALEEPVIVDGGCGSVAVADTAGRWIGGPQAVLAPHGRGKGWGEIGHPDKRCPVSKVWADLVAGVPGAGHGFAAAVDALTRGAERIVLAVPDWPAFAEAAQGRVLAALRGPHRPATLLLWRSVALFLHGLKTGAIPERAGLRVRLLIHDAQGLEVQVLRLAAAEGFCGHLAPARAGFGRLVCPELGLDRYLAAATALVTAAAPELAAGRLEQSRLPIRLLCDRVMPGEREILRRDNGNWVQITCPTIDAATLLPDPWADSDGDTADLTFLASPLVGALFDDLHRRITAEVSDLRVLPWHGIALGALHAGRLIESGRPHYLDTLEPIALAVIGRDDPRFEPLIRPGETVPANREFVSNEMRGFVWGAEKRRIEFFVLKGEGEVRHWTAEMQTSPTNAAEVALQLRQMPGQSWAKLSATSADWEPLAHAPIFLDWENLTPDPRGPEEILATLRRPPPVIPKRVVEVSDIGFWNGAIAEPGLSAILNADADALYEALRTSRRVPFDPFDPTGLRVTIHPISTDGTLPATVTDKDRALLECRLKQLSERVIEDVLAGRVPASRPYLCLTWAFTRCPDTAQDAILDALEAYEANHRHPLHGLPRATTVLQQGAGRTVDDAERLARLVRLLARRTPNSDTRGALSFILSRRASAPQALDDALVDELADSLLGTLRRLLERQSFSRDFNYTLKALVGLLRYRERSPWALVTERSEVAGDLHATLSRIRNHLLEQRGVYISHGREKLAIVRELLEFLTGTGGDPDLLRRIDDLGDD